MHWLEILTIIYIGIGVVIALCFVVQGWFSGDPFTFVSYVFLAGAAPMLWGPVALMLLAWLVISEGIGFLMDLTGVRRY